MSLCIFAFVSSFFTGEKLNPFPLYICGLFRKLNQFKGLEECNESILTTRTSNLWKKIKRAKIYNHTIWCGNSLRRNGGETTKQSTKSPCENISLQPFSFQAINWIYFSLIQEVRVLRKTAKLLNWSEGSVF